MEDEATLTGGAPLLNGGTRIGPYRLIQELGGGGMGTVWEAEQDEPVRRIVALKLIRAGMDTAEVITRFESERQALALMSHPGIAQIFDGGVAPDGKPYFAMELVAGTSITDYCNRNRLGIDERLELFVHVCEAVQHAHQKGIIHRDIKPSNILVTMQDGAAIPKIIDFGVAKATSQPLTGKPSHTRLGELVGTPVYMSPEQFEGGLDIDTRSDVYALGVLLYELLAGSPPFGTGEELQKLGIVEVRRRIVETDPARPSTHARNPHVATTTIRGDLDWIVLKALEKDRTRRYASASEFAADIRRHQRHEPVTAGHPGHVYRMRKFVRRHRVGVGAGVALAAAVLLGIAGTTKGLVQARRAEAEARREAQVAGEVSDFLVGIFEVSNPNESRGNTITAREILDKGAVDVRTRLASEPLVRGRLMGSIGTIYRQLGLYKDSCALLEEAATVMEREAGPDHPKTLDVKGKLASALVLAGQTDKARALLTALVPANERTFGPEAPQTARVLNTLAALYLKTEDYEAAIPVLERSLAIREKTLGSNHVDVSKVLNNLGHARMWLGDFDGSRRDFEHARRIRTAALGPDHPETAKILTNLGMLATERGDKAEGRRYLTQALAILEPALGHDHPDVVETRTLLDEASH